MTRPRRSILQTTALALSLSTSVAARADVPRVTTDIPPVHSLVAQVMGDLGAPTLLLDKPGSAHAHALRPSQAGQLQDSDAVIWVGEGLSPWLARELPILAAGARSLELMALPQTHQRTVRSGATLTEAAGEDDDHDAGHDDGHDEGHASARDTVDGLEREDGHADEHQHHGNTDPHGWLDPHNAALWLDAIAELLSELDAPNAERYRDNAAGARAGLRALEKRIAEQLADTGDRPFVMLHDALGHFERRFGLKARAALTDSDAQAAGPRRVQTVRDTLAGLETPCLFIDIGTSRGTWAPLVDGLSVSTATLDPLGATLQPGPALFGQLLGALSETIGTCLRGT